MEDSEEGLSPRAAAIMLLCVVALGIGLFVLTNLMNRTPDDLRTDRRMYDTQNLWRDRRAEAPPPSTPPTSPSTNLAVP